MNSLVHQSPCSTSRAPSSCNNLNVPKPGRGRADPAHLRRDQHLLPRVRPRAARPARPRHLPALRRHPRLPRLRRVPEPGQRDVDALAGGARQLRRAPRDGRADAAGARRPAHRRAVVRARASRRASTSRPALLDQAWHALDVDAGRGRDGRRGLRGEPRWKRSGSRIPSCRRGIGRPTSRTPSPTPTTRSTTPTSGARCSTPTRWRGSRENGGLTRENGDRYRRYVIGIGGPADPLESYREFRGARRGHPAPPRAPRPPLRPGELGRMPLGSLPAPAPHRRVCTSRRDPSPSSVHFAHVGRGRPRREVHTRREERVSARGQSTGWSRPVSTS